MEQRVSRLNAHILPTIGDVPVTKWRVEHSAKVLEKDRGSAQATARVAKLSCCDCFGASATTSRSPERPSRTGADCAGFRNFRNCARVAVLETQ